MGKMLEVITSGYTELAQSYMAQPRVMRLLSFSMAGAEAATAVLEVDIAGEEW
ncbi:hypothetical protein GCM10023185_17870 [Hymenobacter saemangeumensis]|uniref:Uncharacterized protein n=1 Tax=Hymenobacter saemangeumensis TaxID=1084522 RepID=A0ABP8IB47_9BACT